MKKNSSAYTHIETIAIVMTVIVVTLAVVTFPRMSRNSNVARIRACQTNIDMINTQIEVYYSENDSWPVALKNIIDDPNYFPKGAPVCPAGGIYSINGNHRASCTVHGR
jgi:competence protein ComGC